MKRFAADSMASIPKASLGLSETVAAYYFFDNDCVDWRTLMEPHWQQTQQRMTAHPVILCLLNASMWARTLKNEGVHLMRSGRPVPTLMARCSSTPTRFIVLAC